MELFQIIEEHRPDSVTSWSCSQDAHSGDDVLYFNFTRLALNLQLSSDHQRLTSCRVIDTESLFPRKRIDPLREEVRRVIQAICGDGSSLVREFDLEIAILQALESICELEFEFEPTLNPVNFEKGWGAEQVSDWNEVLNNPHGLDVSTIQDTASHILGKTPAELVADIPKEWRVIHMESVLRPDLLRRYWNYKDTLSAELEADETRLRDRLSPHSKLDGRVRARLSRDSILEDMVTPRITYHGTPLKSVSSIVRYGFKMPGNVVSGKVVSSPRTGVAYNRGIYSSQAPFYALSFAAGQRDETPVGLLPSMRLFVCATVMGRTYMNQDGQHQVHGPLVQGYDSHFDGKFEYIVHDERAMLPCYVIHLDLGSEVAKQALKDAQLHPTGYYSWDRERKKRQPEVRSTAPGDVRREREARKAAAMKWFPYGFGPATGTRFVIEEIGDISDDEEEYGDWQAEKHGFSNSYLERTGIYEEDEDKYYDEFDEEGNVTKKKKGLLMDQYQHAMRSSLRGS
ncbi:hypothetical protein FZEAL_5385 [Fusarium zealandicum]|uniref:PARP catalytic domain-containing protein n=1 Tax=Fusarium zealandicum TaxID=1053134 RepID=A0A8H4UK95_9HYPO|nr:hypothetical protein FZEAL_5385 [Fusarium zealandicum]